MEKDWYKDLVVYQIYPKSFMDSNNDGIGDIKGIISKLDYIKSIGVNAIWLSPVYCSPFKDNGYDISNYKDIAPVFGTMDDFKEFLTKAHNLELKVIMDLVINHTSDEHEWFKISSKSRDNAYSDYYIWHDPVDGHEPNNWESCFGGSAWEYVKERDQYYLHLFSKGQPDLNYSSPKLKKEIFDMVRWWCELGVDGFRVDAISYLEKAPFTYSPNKENAMGYAFCMDICSGREGTHSIIKELRKIFDEYNCMSVGEVSVSNVEELYKYSSDSRKEFNMAIPFIPPVVEIDTFTPSNMRKSIIESYEILKSDGCWARFLSNHDKPRQVSLYGDDKKYYKESAKLLALITHLLPGTPFIYQGEEIGMTNIYYPTLSEYDDIDTKNFYEHELAEGKSKEDAFKRAQMVSRDNARSPMQWDDTLYGGFSNSKPWLGVNDNHTTINVKNENNDITSILNFYRNIIKIRLTSKALRRGTLEFIFKDSEKLFAYKRELDGEEYVVITNFSKDEELINFPFDNYTLVISNYNSNYSKSSLTLKPYEALLLKRK